MKKSTIPPRSNGKHPGGRPSKKTPATVAKIAEAIANGLPDHHAAALAGITNETLREWKADEEFSLSIKSAVAARLTKRLARVEAGRLGWQGTAWILERCYAAEFARPEIQLNQQLNIQLADKTIPYPIVRIIVIPDNEFEECQTQEVYQQLADGSLERTEGSLRIQIFRQSAETKKKL